MPIGFQATAFGYRRRSPVIQDFTFSFPPGRTVFLGPNGAGKSTILSLGASVLRPQSGTVTHDGLRTDRRGDLAAYRRRIAWLPQQIESVPRLTAREQIAYVGWLKGMNRRDAWDASLDALRRVELADFADRKVHQLSGGQQRRVGIAQSLVHEAEVLLLDEPTAGMDPRQRRVFHEILGGLDQHVLLSTHDVADLEDTYDHVVVLNGGTVRFAGPVREFHALAPPGTASGRLAEAAYYATVQEEEAACA
ncbi:ATP-binding cassette domain-containing protein [Streptomyces sp. SID4985]|uniref:ABC transporter ATP-binding protein n=1 Tax=unclassified Streptomyces TaxID=2593676 RepID=UPI0013709C31|nr:ATP-binding cassette domain-containing protein [Streptomyces sp. SID4985]MYQ45369.1 ATP-binding cassette domain-containing protein [Streptomyces sp. SID4985]